MNPIDKLTALFERFPGIGPRQARRFVQYLLTANPAVRQELAEHIKALAAQTNQCKKCYRWYAKNDGGSTLCSICSSSQRDQSILFIVEKDADIDNVERSGFKGLYFVLGGTIPLASEEPTKYIRLNPLLKRVEGEAATLTEVILGLSATTEGDHTRQILQEKLRDLPVKLSSLGRGLSTGSELEYADPDTIAQALGNRH
ncbi:MAG TPA: toprim domain-containing protein [Candidatus Paceibacterota bacterium]